MTSFSGCEDKKKRECVFVCNVCRESESLCITLFSYADEPVLLFTVHKLWCMFIYGNIQYRIKALMSHNTLSGSHVGGLLLRRHVVCMKGFFGSTGYTLMSMSLSFYWELNI